MNDEILQSVPLANEPQDVTDVGPTPYKFLFEETSKKIKNFTKEVKKKLKTEGKNV